VFHCAVSVIGLFIVIDSDVAEPVYELVPVPVQVVNMYRVLCPVVVVWVTAKFACWPVSYQPCPVGLPYGELTVR